MKTIYDFSVKDRKGKDVSLKEYANEVLLIVNTPQNAVSPHNTTSWRHSTRSTIMRALKSWTSPATSLANRLPVQTRVSMSSAS